MKYKKPKRKKSDRYWQGLYNHIGRCMKKEFENEQKKEAEKQKKEAEKQKPGFPGLHPSSKDFGEV